MLLCDATIGRIMRTQNRMKPQKNTNSKKEEFNTQLNRGEHVSTIYIGNLSFNKREGEIKKLFQKFGKVTYVKSVLDSKTKKNKGIAFVQMVSKLGAETAIEELNGKEVDGRTLKVSMAIDNEKPFYLDPSQKPIKALKTKKSTNSNSENPPIKSSKKTRKKKRTGLDSLFDYLGSSARKS